MSNQDETIQFLSEMTGNVTNLAPEFRLFIFNKIDKIRADSGVKSKDPLAKSKIMAICKPLGRGWALEAIQLNMKCLIND